MKQDDGRPRHLTESGHVVITERVDDLLIEGMYDTTERHCFLWTVKWQENLDLLAWCLLNPAEDVPGVFNRTGRTVRAITQSHGQYGGFKCVNVLSRVATDPSGIRAGTDFWHSDNDLFLKETAECHSDIVCAWGNSAPFIYVNRALEILDGLNLLCPGTTLIGNPRHPGRLPHSTKLIPWSMNPE